MKKQLSYLPATLLAAVFFFAACKAPQHAAQSANFMSDSSFVFSVQTVNPLNGGSRQITGDYQLRLSKSQLFADLPYFGRSYSAPVNPTDGGIKLNTNSFTYNLREKRKDWEVEIKPGNQREVQSMLLSVSESGYGTLQVTSTNRQSISYYGRVSGAAISK